MTSDWQTIDSAPKDGTRILATCGRHMIVTLWGKANHVPLYSWLFLDIPYDPENYDFWQPTHWMPLPALPATPAKEKAA